MASFRFVDQSPSYRFAMYMFQFLDVLARGEHVEVVGPRLPKRALLTLDADDSWSDMEGTHISNTSVKSRHILYVLSGEILYMFLVFWECVSKPRSTIVERGMEGSISLTRVEQK
jgi:hypothetical protein